MRIPAYVQRPETLTPRTVIRRHDTYCFDALVEDGFVDEVEFAKLPNEFDVAKHLDLCNRTLLLLLSSEFVVIFVKD